MLRTSTSEASPGSMLFSISGLIVLDQSCWKSASAMYFSFAMSSVFICHHEVGR